MTVAFKRVAWHKTESFFHISFEYIDSSWLYYHGLHSLKQLGSVRRLRTLPPIRLKSRVHFLSLETEDGHFGNATRCRSNAASARCSGAVGGASGSAEDGEEILDVAHDNDEQYVDYVW